jgi:CheY-like chemotaxis protein
MAETSEPSNFSSDPRRDSLTKPAGSTPGGVSGQSSSTHVPNGRVQDQRPGGSGDRRKRRRALISASIRVRAVRAPIELLEGPDEISTTLDVSRNGVLFVSSLSTFVAGMEVAVAFPYTKAPQVPLAERFGRIVRVTEIPDGRQSVAIALSGNAESASDDSSCARAQKLHSEKPLVLLVDANRMIRDSLKTYLSTEGYEVFAVSCAAEAHEVLKMFTPALLISEIEGDDLPGLELCAHCKATPRLQTVPVVLLTRSAYPSDYANAHSLGAVVCMAKPYRQERLRHIVRLLAPTEEHKQPVAVRPVDPTRRASARPQNKVKRPSMLDSLEHRPHWRV